MEPLLLVVAGPNGAGKTTVTRRLLRDQWSEGVEYLNPDDIARDRFGGWDSMEAVVQAAEWTAARREELLEARAGIAFETAFSAPDKLEFVERAVDAGYFVRVFFIGTSDPAINAGRVARRVMEGGHSVPIEKIIVRHRRAMANLTSVISLAHRVYVFDNSVEDADATLCVRTTDGKVRKIYGELPSWVHSAIARVPRHEEYEDLRNGSKSPTEAS